MAAPRLLPENLRAMSRVTSKASDNRAIASLRWLPAIALATVLTASAAASEDPTTQQPYSIEPGDRINVTVFGQPELSGDLTVDGNGAVDLPFIGQLVVRNLTIPECQKVITARLADGVLVKPAVNVRVSEFRQLYILGDVRTPGAYAFHYGLTIKGAIAAAGGYAATETVQNTAVADYLTANERVRELSLQKLALMVREARLEAQRDGADSFSPPNIADAADERSFAAIVAAEQDTFNAQTSILKAQIDQMLTQKPRLNSEIEAVKNQILVEQKQVEIIKKEAEQYGGLIKQGLGLATSQMQLQLEQTARESDNWRLQAELSRLQMDAGEFDIKIQEVQAIYKRQIVTDLLDVRQRLREAELSLESAKAIRNVKLRPSDSLASSDVQRSIVITRAQGGKESVLTATESTPLEPGDIIDITRAASPTPVRGTAARDDKSAQIVTN
jgi:polysaccharide biosynthesis/export protein